MNEEETDFAISVDLTGGVEAEAVNGARKPRGRRKAPGEAAGTRREHDAYGTEYPVALAICRQVQALGLAPASPGGPGFKILDPTAGSGVFCKAAREVWPSAAIGAVDIEEKHRVACEAILGVRFMVGDATALPVCPADLIVTNPPFKRATEIVLNLWPKMHDGAVLALLLPVTFLGSDDRWSAGGKKSNLFNVAPLYDLKIIVPRPSFGMETGPKFEAAMFTWVKGRKGNFDALRWNRP